MPSAHDTVESDASRAAAPPSCGSRRPRAGAGSSTGLSHRLHALRRFRVDLLHAFDLVAAAHAGVLLLVGLSNLVPVTCVEINRWVGCTDNSSLSHFSATTWPRWLRRAVRNRHRHAIEQASRRWHGGRRGDSGRTRRKFDFHTAVTPSVCVESRRVLTRGRAPARGPPCSAA